MAVSIIDAFTQLLSESFQGVILGGLALFVIAFLGASRFRGYN